MTLRSIILSALILMQSSFAFADQPKSELLIENAWSKPNFGPNGAAYMTVTNKGEEAIEIIEATSPIAPRIELHEHTHDEGVMRMRRIKGGVVIKQGETVKFKPAGKHIMLFNMHEKLKPGAAYPLTLKFKKRASKTISIKVKDAPESHKPHH